MGQFTNTQDTTIPFGYSVRDIIVDITSEYSYPIFFDAPIGHVQNNYAFIHGAHGRIFGEDTFRLDYNLSKS